MTERGLPEKGVKGLWAERFPPRPGTPRGLPGGGGPETTGVQCEPVRRPPSAHSPQDAAAARQVGASCPAAKGPGAADSSQAQRSLPAHRTLTLRGLVCRWGAGAGRRGVLALRKVERVPQREAVSTVWTRTAGRLGPARHRPPERSDRRELTPTPPHLLDHLLQGPVSPTPHPPEVSPCDLCSPGPPKREPA